MNQPRLLSLVGTVLIIAILVVGWFGVISPQLNQISLANNQITQIDVQNRALSQTLATLRSQSVDLPKLTAELDALRLQVPETSDVDTFVHELNSLATANGIELTGLTVPEAVAYPAAPAAATPATSPSTAVSGAATATPTPTPTPVPTALTAPTTTTSPTDVQPSAALRADLYTLNLTMTLSGPGSGILSFLQAVQKGSRLFLVTTVSVSTQAPNALGTATIGGYLFIVSPPAATAAQSTATPTPSATATPSPTGTPVPTGTPTPSATGSPSATASPKTTPSPTPTP